MIRLTEEGREGTVVDLKVEGALTGETLLVVNEVLEDCLRDGVDLVRLGVDGLVSVDRLELQKWYGGLPARPGVVFCTSRVAVEVLLEGCSIAAVRRGCGGGAV